MLEFEADSKKRNSRSSWSFVGGFLTGHKQPFVTRNGNCNLCKKRGTVQKIVIISPLEIRRTESLKNGS